MTLNDEQKAIVEAMPKLKKTLKILAGAGSGKSTTITHKVKYMMDNYHIQASRILMVTFSNRAARDLRAKLKSNTGMKYKDLPTVSTIHGMCLDLLRKYDTEDYIVLSTWENLMLYRNALEERLKRPELPKYITTTIAGAINDLLSELYSTYNIEKHTGNLGYSFYDNSEKYQEADQHLIVKLTYRDFYEIVNEVDAHKKEHNLLSFDDILYRTFEMIKADDKILTSIRKTYPYVFVDECLSENCEVNVRVCD